jgi:hypothetical protein
MLWSDCASPNSNRNKRRRRSFPKQGEQGNSRQCGMDYGLLKLTIPEHRCTHCIGDSHPPSTFYPRLDSRGRAGAHAAFESDGKLIFSVTLGTDWDRSSSFAPPTACHSQIVFQPHSAVGRYETCRQRRPAPCATRQRRRPSLGLKVEGKSPGRGMTSMAPKRSSPTPTPAHVFLSSFSLLLSDPPSAHTDDPGSPRTLGGAPACLPVWSI